MLPLFACAGGGAPGGPGMTLILGGSFAELDVRSSIGGGGGPMLSLLS